MVALGCAGDADPEPNGSLELVAEHGLAVATEVDRLLSLPLLPLGPVPAPGSSGRRSPWTTP